MKKMYFFKFLSNIGTNFKYIFQCPNLQLNNVYSVMNIIYNKDMYKQYVHTLYYVGPIHKYDLEHRQLPQRVRYRNHRNIRQRYQ